MSDAIERIEGNHKATIRNVFAKAGVSMLAHRVIVDIDAVLVEVRELRVTLASVESDLCGAAALDNIAHAAYLDGNHG